MVDVRGQDSAREYFFARRQSQIHSWRGCPDFRMQTQLPSRFGCNRLYPCSCAQSVSGIAAKSSTTGTACPSFVRSIVRMKNLHVSQVSTRICGNCSAT